MATEPLPSNSRIGRVEPKQERDEERKIEKVVEGTVIRRKKPWHKRLIQTFVGGEDASSIFTYIAQDLIVPATKDLVVDALTTTVERVFLGDAYSDRGRHRHRSSASSRTEYGGMASRTIRRDEPRREMSSRAKEQHDFDEIVLNSKSEADVVIENLFNCLDKFDLVTVFDLYSLAGITPSFTDRKWGWEGPDALRGTRAVRVNGGYLLDLPRPDYIS